jgi:hypothetical protein
MSENGPLPNIGFPKFLKVAKVARTDLLATFKEAWVIIWRHHLCRDREEFVGIDDIDR